MAPQVQTGLSEGSAVATNVATTLSTSQSCVNACRASCAGTTLETRQITACAQDPNSIQCAGATFDNSFNQANDLLAQLVNDGSLPSIPSPTPGNIIGGLVNGGTLGGLSTGLDTILPFKEKESKAATTRTVQTASDVTTTATTTAFQPFTSFDDIFNGMPDNEALLTGSFLSDLTSTSVNSINAVVPFESFYNHARELTARLSSLAPGTPITSDIDAISRNWLSQFADTLSVFSFDDVNAPLSLSDEITNGLRDIASYLNFL